MARYTLIISLAVLVFNVQVFGATWYIENFDKYKNGDIVGQDDWEIAMNQKTSQIQGKVKHGDVGKSSQAFIISFAVARDVPPNLWTVS